jgi:hypothetical protein
MSETNSVLVAVTVLWSSSALFDIMKSVNCVVGAEDWIQTRGVVGSTYLQLSADHLHCPIN